jgi:hypothetical protein
MGSRLKDIPVYEAVNTELEAQRFNQVRLSLLRVANPLRFDIPSLRDMAIILEDDAWICVDQSMDDLPIVAWTGFHTRSRTGLHEPVPCKRLSFHAHAHLIIDTVLKTISTETSKRLQNYQPKSSRVSSIYK